MREDPFLPRLRAIADILTLPNVRFYDMHRLLGGYDHVISVFPRGDEWHVVIDPPVVTRARGFDPAFPENGAMRIEHDFRGACDSAKRAAYVARGLGRSAIVIASSDFQTAVAPVESGRRL